MFAFQYPFRSSMKHLLKNCSEQQEIVSLLIGGMGPSMPHSNHAVDKTCEELPFQSSFIPVLTPKFIFRRMQTFMIKKHLQGLCSQRTMLLQQCSFSVKWLGYCQEYMALNRKPSFSLSLQIVQVDPVIRAEPSVRMMSRWFSDTVNITYQKRKVGGRGQQYILLPNASRFIKGSNFTWISSSPVLFS